MKTSNILLVSVVLALGLLMGGLTTSTLCRVYHERGYADSLSAALEADPPRVAVELAAERERYYTHWVCCDSIPYMPERSERVRHEASSWVSCYAMPDASLVRLSGDTLYFDPRGLYSLSLPTVDELVLADGQTFSVGGLDMTTHCPPHWRKELVFFR